MRRFPLVAVALTGGLAVAALAADDPTPFCGTFERWAAKAPAAEAFGGACPTQGDCDIPAIRDAFAPGASTPMRWFRVHFIVFAEDDGSNPAATEAEVVAQVANLNADFLPWRIQFTHTVEFKNDSAALSGFDSSGMKDAHALNPESQCNIFVNEYSGGIGTFPWDSDALTNQGGIIQGNGYFTADHHVLTHEMGHNLGLWHTHHGVNEVNSCSDCYEAPNGADNDTVGDFCADTPPRPSDFGLCEPPGGDDGCSGAPWGDTQPENFMSYGSGDGIACWTLFTPQQAARAHCWSESVLQGWYDCTMGDDCNGNGVSDRCDIRDGTSLDLDGDFIPDECAGAGPADLNGDGVIGFADLLIVLAAWGPCVGCPSDFDASGDVGLSDLLFVLSSWTR